MLFPNASSGTCQVVQQHPQTGLVLWSSWGVSLCSPAHLIFQEAVWLRPCSSFFKQHREREWGTPARRSLMHYDVWALGYDISQQRTGQALWSHRHDQTACLFNPKADASARQAADPLQLRPCELRRPREPLAPSGSRNVRPTRSAGGVQVDAPQQSPDLAPQHAQAVPPGQWSGKGCISGSKGIALQSLYRTCHTVRRSGSW